MSSRKGEAKQLKRAVKYLMEKSDIDDMIKIYSKIAELPLRNRPMICFNCPARKEFCENHLGMTCEQALHNWAWNNKSLQEVTEELKKWKVNINSMKKHYETWDRENGGEKK